MGLFSEMAAIGKRNEVNPLRLTMAAILQQQ